MLISVCSLRANAQDSPFKFRPELWLGLQVAIPVGEFGDSLSYDPGVGGNVGIVFGPLKNSNFFQLGAEFGLTHMKTQKNEIKTQSEPEYHKTISTLHDILMVARFKKQKENKVIPFLDGLVGGKIFVTKTKYNNNFLETLFNSENKDKYRREVSSVWTYGAAAGVAFNLQPPTNASDETEVIEIRVMYLASGNMSYDAPENVTYSGVNPQYHPTALSKTNMVMLQINYKAIF